MRKIINPEGKWILIAAAILLFAGLGRSDIYILDEARNAQCGREMWQKNEWIVPTFNNELRPQKPPLHYYFMKAAYSMFSPTAFAARFFSAFMGLALLVFLWWRIKKHFDERTAFWTVATLTASVHFIFEFRLAVPDPYLIAFITAGVFLFYEYAQSRKLIWLILSGICAALAILSKGPVALALPAFAIIGWAISTKQWKLLFHWHLLVYSFIILAVAAPWFYWVHVATNGAFTNEFFLTHNINRFKEPMEGHGGLFIIVPLVVVLGMLPLVWFAFRNLKKLRSNDANGLLQLGVWVVLVFVVFFSISGTKLPNYAMPCYPFLALLAGYGISSFIQSQKKVQHSWFLTLIILNLLLCVGAFIGLGLEKEVAHLKYASIVFLIPLVGLVWGWMSYKTDAAQITLVKVLSTYLVFLLVANVWIYPTVYAQNPVTQTKALLPVDETIYAYKIYNPAYNFYLNKPVKQWETISDFKDSLPIGKTAYIISRQEFAKDFEGLPVKIIATKKDIFENPTTVLLKWEN